MSDPVFVSGDFSSGTTLLFTMLRATEGCHCLYEPLHERLLPWLFWPPRAYEGHGHVGQYFTEYKGFSAIPELFDPEWGVRGLYLGADDPEERLQRYLSYLIGSAYGRAPRVVLKDNRFTFRLAWLREHFPRARIVHVHRGLEDQWESWVRRAQNHLGRADVGQDSVEFMGFRLAAWCDDLAPTFPELAADRSSSGFERFSKLWHLSQREHAQHADVSVSLAELKTDFATACRRISEGVGFQLDAPRLELLLERGGERRGAPTNRLRRETAGLVDRAGARYAELRVARATRRADRRL